MKRLILLRHAKSDWDAEYSVDRERPLSKRGREAAATMGRLLSAIGQDPDVVVSSSALRARATAELAAEAGSWTATIELNDRLYGASAGDVIDVIRTIDGSINKAMMVGHEPAWSTLVGAITGGSVRMATATAAGIDLASWSSCGPGSGEIAFVLPPRPFGSIFPGQ